MNQLAPLLKEFITLAYWFSYSSGRFLCLSWLGVAGRERGLGSAGVVWKAVGCLFCGVGCLMAGIRGVGVGGVGWEDCGI